MKKTINWDLLDKTQKVEITPVLAASLLSKNIINRNIRKMSVFNYSQDMIRHEWKENNPSPIIVRQDRTLLDGQHRLSAIIESGKTLSWNLYIEGDNSLLPMDLMIDRPVPRSNADMMGVHPGVIAVINRLLADCTYGSGFRPSLKDVSDFYEKYIKSDEVIFQLLKKSQKPLWSNASSKSVALAYYLSDEIVKDYVLNIIQAMVTRNIDGKPIIQKAYIKVYERTYSPAEISKIAMILFNPKCSDNKIIKINKYVSIPQFFRNHLDDIGYAHYYERLLPYITMAYQERKIKRNSLSKSKSK